MEAQPSFPGDLTALLTKHAPQTSRQCLGACALDCGALALTGGGCGTFNLCAQDLENTTGAWDMYGVDEKKRYPGMQEEFFQRATDAVSRRESLNGFVALCKWEGCWCEYVCASLFKLFMVSTDSACK
eukprot:1159030-Pelagomonas_calceolata.AAC.3